MPRYIDADEFEKRIKPYDTDDEMDKALYNFAHNIMMCTSTADVRLNVHAHWIKHKDADFDERGASVPNYECSNCHMWFPDYGKFCSECGADMRERRE